MELGILEQNKGAMAAFNSVESGDTLAVIETTMGTITVKLLPDIAPKTVENFVGLAKKDYYAGVIFHRVIEQFMIQGGDPTGTGRGGESFWGGKFEDEFSQRAHNFCSALSMANAGPGTNGSQFFIVQKSTLDPGYVAAMQKAGWPEDVVAAYSEAGGTPHLDGKHTVFGYVIEGMDVVNAIAGVKTDGGDKPLEDVVMRSVTIKTAE